MGGGHLLVGVLELCSHSHGCGWFCGRRRKSGGFSVCWNASNAVASGVVEGIGVWAFEAVDAIEISGSGGKGWNFFIICNRGAGVSLQIHCRRGANLFFT